MVRNLIVVLAVLVASVCLAPSSQAKRVALVIGNGAYEHAVSLPNPRNDALDIAAALRVFGFEVHEGLDLDEAEFSRKVRDFVIAARDADAALFYYAGHGLQVEGRNYLVPVDARLADEADLRFEALELADIADLMERASPVSLIFLDACRDNPLAHGLARSLGASRSTSVGRGLARVNGGVGTLIAYATQPGNVAADGSGRNSPFTAALLEHLATPGLEVNQLLNRVRQTVVAVTDHQQIPWTHSSLTGDFYMSTVGYGTAPADATPAPSSAFDARQLELEFWRGVKDSEDWEDLQAYLNRYGDGGAFAALARVRLKRLKGQESESAAVASSTTAVPDSTAVSLTPGTRFRDCAACPEMVVVPSGSFNMGSNVSYLTGHLPVHRVTIQRDFAVGIHEVTFAEWDACVEAGGCQYRPDDAGWGRGRRPVVHIDWFDAKDYLHWLSVVTGKEYRLLSEAEWEYAARAGSKEQYSWGNAIGRNRANCSGCGSQWDGATTAPVGSFEPNAFGLHDMHGNAFEWVEDCAFETYNGAPSDGSAWLSPNEKDCWQRIARGGSYFNDPISVTASYRYPSYTGEHLRDKATGFRVAREL